MWNTLYNSHVYILACKVFFFCVLHSIVHIGVSGQLQEDGLCCSQVEATADVPDFEDGHFVVMTSQKYPRAEWLTQDENAESPSEQY